MNSFLLLHWEGMKVDLKYNDIDIMNILLLL